MMLSTSEVFGLTLKRQLLLEIRRELQDLRRDVSEIKGLLVRLLSNDDHFLDPLSLHSGQKIIFPEIPGEIRSKFSYAIRTNSPETYQDLASMPLKEGFDALVYHFSQVGHHQPRD